MGDGVHRSRGRAVDAPGRDPPEGFVRRAWLRSDGPSWVERERAPLSRWEAEDELARREAISATTEPIAARLARILARRASLAAASRAALDDTPDAPEASESEAAE